MQHGITVQSHEKKNNYVILSPGAIDLEIDSWGNRKGSFLSGASDWG